VDIFNGIIILIHNLNINLKIQNNNKYFMFNKIFIQIASYRDPEHAHKYDKITSVFHECRYIPITRDIYESKLDILKL
jgi:hypothetical protein